MKNFSVNLKKIRESKNLSQKAVATLISVPVSTYANWEQGRREPSILDIRKIIDCLDIDANELFDIDVLN